MDTPHILDTQGQEADIANTRPVAPIAPMTLSAMTGEHGTQLQGSDIVEAQSTAPAAPIAPMILNATAANMDTPHDQEPIPRTEDADTIDARPTAPIALMSLSMPVDEHGTTLRDLLDPIPRTEDATASDARTIAPIAPPMTSGMPVDEHGTTSPDLEMTNAQVIAPTAPPMTLSAIAVNMDRSDSHQTGQQDTGMADARAAAPVAPMMASAAVHQHKVAPQDTDMVDAQPMAPTAPIAPMTLSAADADIIQKQVASAASATALPKHSTPQRHDTSKPLFTPSPSPPSPTSSADAEGSTDLEFERLNRTLVQPTPSPISFELARKTRQTYQTCTRVYWQETNEHGPGEWVASYENVHPSRFSLKARIKAAAPRPGIMVPTEENRVKRIKVVAEVVTVYRKVKKVVHRSEPIIRGFIDEKEGAPQHTPRRRRGRATRSKRKAGEMEDGQEGAKKLGDEEFEAEGVADKELEQLSARDKRVREEQSARKTK